MHCIPRIKKCGFYKYYVGDKDNTPVSYWIWFYEYRRYNYILQVAICNKIFNYCIKTQYIAYRMVAQEVTSFTKFNTVQWISTHQRSWTRYQRSQEPNIEIIEFSITQPSGYEMTRKIAEVEWTAYIIWFIYYVINFKNLSIC